MRIVAFCMVLWCGFASAYAAGSSFTAELDKTEGSVDDQFVLTLSVAGSADGEPSVPAIPGLNIQAAGTSQNVSIINGTVSKEVQYQYVLTASKAGKYTVPSLNLTVDGQKMTTLPLSFTVAANGQGGADQEDRGAVFLERELSSTSPYVGEQIVCKVRLYYRVRMTRAEPHEELPPALSRTPIKGEKRYTKVVNGQTYQVVELDELLVPLKAGRLTLPPYEVAATLLQPRTPRHSGGLLDDLLNDPMFNIGNEVTKTVQSDAATLEVQPLPKNAKPTAFSGLVGEFHLAATLSQRQLNVGDTATLTLTLSGDGSLDGMTPLSFNPPGNLRVYADRPSTTPDNALGPTATRSFKFALVPEAPGTIKLGTYSIAVFNPRTRAYEDLTVPLGDLNVTGTAVVSTPPATAPLVQQPVHSTVDLADLHRDVSGHEALTGADHLRLALACGLPLALLLVSLWRQRTHSEVDLRRKAALAAFKQRLAADTSIAGTSAAVRAYLGDKLGIAGRALTASELVSRLSQSGLDATFVGQFEKLLKAFDEVQFKGGAQENADLKARAEALVKESETKWPH